MKNLHKDDLINWGLLVLLGIVWGFSFFFIKRGLVAFDAFQVGAIRIFIAFLSFVPLVFFIGLKVPLKKAPVLMLSSLLGSGIPPFLFAFAQQRIDSGVTGILNALTPLFALIAGFVVFKVPVKPHHLIGVLAGIAGTVIVVILKSDGSFDFNFAYSLLVILATIFYGINANIIKSTLHNVHPIQIALFTFLFIGPFAGIYLFTTDFLTVMQTHEYAWRSLIHLILLSVFGTGYALILFNYLAHRTSALFATMVTYIIPIVALLIGVIDGEQLGWIQVAGLVLILLGVYISSIRNKKEKLAVDE